MTSKNPTHIRGLYGVNDWYNEGKYRYHYFINYDDYCNDEIRYRTRDIRRFYNLRKKYYPKDKKFHTQNLKSSKKRKVSPNSKIYRRYQVGVQTSDSLMFDDSDFERMICVFDNDHFNNDLFLFPYLKRRLMIKYFRLWINRFYRVRAFKLQQNQLINDAIDNQYQYSSDESPENVINFDFESSDDEIIENNNNNKEKIIHLQYGPDNHGIKDVTFKVM